MSCGPFTARPDSTERQPTGLCTHCRVLQLHDIDPDQISASQKYELKYERHDSIPGLPLIAQSAAAGCGVCRMLHGEIMDALAHLDEPGPVKICRVVVEFYENQMAFEIESPCGTTRVSFFTAADSGLQGVEKLGITQKHVPEDLFSSAGLANVHNFINQALEWSPPPTAIPTLPTRLIDVGGRPDQEDPRLVIPHEHPPLRDSAPTDVAQRRYIALSYCWGTPHAGGSQLLKTETSNLAEFRERIPLDLFPPALRDAILLTRRVCGGAVRYIWIDALCIVQDDRRDWEREAARMAAVYQNAYLTFCSTLGSCGESFARRPNETAEVPFSQHLAASDAGGMGVEGSYHLTRWMAENFEWDSRGWTMQEIYFSARALLFSKMQTYLWDTHSAAEADEDGVRVPGEAVFQPESRRQWWAEQVVEGRSWRLDDDDDGDDANPELARRRLYENWYGKMIAYSRRSLTFAADRLPAISALASRMQAKFDALGGRGGGGGGSGGGLQKETYVAGLWALDLPGGLLWSVSVFDADPAPSFADYVAQRTDPELYTAPSWSWACQDETAFFYGHGANFAALGAVESVDVRPAGLDVFGRVRGGEVVVGGWMARVPWGYFEVNQVDREEGGMNYEAVRRDGGVRTGPGGIRLMAPGGGEAEVEFDWWVEDERHAEYWPSGTFAVMLVGMSVYPEELVPRSPEEGWELFRKAAEVKGEPGDRLVVQEDGEVARFDSIFVLGIVLHETEEPGVYLRAGYLRGSAFEDTLAELRDAKYRTVKIV